MPDFDPFLAEWAAFAASARHSLVERGLKMAQLLEYPDLDIAAYAARIAAMRESFRLDVDRARGPTGAIGALNAHVFGTCGFRGNFEDHYDPRNNFLNEVIDRRTGIAITVSIIYAEVARGAGIDVGLVSFPGRVLARHGDVVIDAVAGGRILSEGDVAALLEAAVGPGAELTQALLAPATPERLLVRMARNLKHSYMHSYAHDRALRCARMALALAPDSAEDVRDAGLLEARLQNRKGAIEHLGRYLEINPNGDDVDHVLEIIRQMRSSL